MNYRNIHKIILSILILGLINQYNILKFGIILYLPNFDLNYIQNIDSVQIVSKSFDEAVGCLTLGSEPYEGVLIQPAVGSNLQEKSIFKLDINTIKILIFISIIIFLIFNFNSPLTWPARKSEPRREKEYSLQNQQYIYIGSKKIKMEYELLIGLGLLGLFIILISNEFISLYLGLELYSFSIYVLILVKETISIGRISIIYLILSSISSGFLLFSFYYLYKIFGTLNYEYILEISQIRSLSPLGQNWYDFASTGIKTPFGCLFLILLALLFKLGTGPFIYWLIRLYIDLEKKIFWYQITIPKLIFFIILIKFITLFSVLVPTDIQIWSDYNKFLAYFLLIIAIISIIFGAIGGLFQERDNLLISYSSILNIGYVLLTLSLLILIQTTGLNQPVPLAFPGGEGVGQEESISGLKKIWIIYQYFFVYFINLLGLFSILYLYKRSSKISLFSSFFSNPFFFICFFFLILSFIGIPPFSGFFSKFYLFFTLFSFPTITIFSLFIFVFFSIISSFFYLKFIFSSSVSSFESFHKSQSSGSESISYSLLTTNLPTFATYLLSFSTIFSLSYPLYISLFIPYYILSF